MLKCNLTVLTGGDEMSNYANEEKLTGGNVSNVYRSKNTVRRELKPDSVKIHKLLQHLENKGFHYAPKFLGIDEKNREILSFIEGEAGNYPLKEYMRSNDVLKEIAKMLRLYHDAVSEFPLLDDWKPMDHTPNNIEVLCHNDFAIYNIIFNNEKPVGIIDFDVAAPGPRIWDIAYTLYTCVPLSRTYYTESGEAVHYESAQHAGRMKERIKLFVQSYGKSMDEDYLGMVLLRLEALCTYMKRKANEGDVNFQRMMDEGHLEHYEKDMKFIRDYGAEWI